MSSVFRSISSIRGSVGGRRTTLSRASRVSTSSPAKATAVDSSDMRLLTVGDLAPDFELVDREGNKRTLSSLRGRRVLLSFYRFAACPLCLYNEDRRRRQADLFKKAGVVTVSVYRSAPESVARVNSGTNKDDGGEDHNLALSDRKGKAFEKFMVPRSKQSAVGGMAHMAKNFKRYRQFFDFAAMMRDTKGGTDMKKMSTLPADFMIDEGGVIVDLFRAERMTDHMPFERVEAFIPEGKRCRCNRKDCLSPRCRANHEEIMKEWEQTCNVYETRGSF